MRELSRALNRLFEQLASMDAEVTATAKQKQQKKLPYYGGLTARASEQTEER